MTPERRPVVGVMGAGEPGEASLAAARKLGRLLAERGWIVLTGGRPAGVMAAACAGAKEIPGALTLGILPGLAGAGAEVDIAVFTGMGDARNAINVLTSDVVIACGVEGPGTTSEIALALKAGKPVILLNGGEAAARFFRGLRSPGRLLEAGEPEEAVRLIEQELAVPRWSRSSD
ncbi:MAG TPA: hypothetical protein VFU40_12280 [Gemmatimonadales bacterium]|nr:hypothetical protein [Gemmatimonadales bacterium]